MNHAPGVTTFPQHFESIPARDCRSVTTLERADSDTLRRTAPDIDDDLLEQDILAILLTAHPAQRSIEELVRELAGSTTGFAKRDRINNGVRELVGAGLAHRHGQFVFASRAAVRFDELRF